MNNINIFEKLTEFKIDKLELINGGGSLRGRGTCVLTNCHDGDDGIYCDDQEDDPAMKQSYR